MAEKKPEPRPKEKEPYRTFLARAGQSDDRLANRQEERKIRTNLYWHGVKRGKDD
jgi:hypothetical protein